MQFWKLRHAVDHLQAVVSNEMALVINTWNVITADNSIGHFEKKRMIRVCQGADNVMTDVSKHVGNIELSENMLDKLKINTWASSRPIFDFSPVTKSNFAQWTEECYKAMQGFERTLSILRSVLLEDLLEKETALKAHHKAGTTPEPICPPKKARPLEPVSTRPRRHPDLAPDIGLDWDCGWHNIRRLGSAVAR